MGRAGAASVPVSGGGLDKPTDRNQWGWVFLKDSKDILSEKQNPQKYPQKYYSFRETQASRDNNGDP